ncbi:hypothetical protein [Leptothoe kymatousa]|uniref:Uncharacterized protein n=1 Tax=Leptothoe kymatousa TAU-MAC 1615 TaxID=2364775 RepID=A0ABS5XZH2_9CYAN|nr:hypothetical protein [Leptothoe kymatousa]MBT9311002.1 hypothetical protein [Leptothoe kymatousa TAU-MAC 1615]
MEISLLRLIWCVVDETLTRCTAGVSQCERVQLILHQIDDRVQLSQNEYATVKQYLLERQQLIQELYYEQAM